ncbi:DMT family transporter [Acidaminobacter sp. JC074]|uniref:DMT family transporter n=1 Tax=Acidaminobacter sp. JC074 TaxID=2530199 RepID=UPI001F0E0103|nr:DMT family transporter [Acidaminobacter sp. JC074]MCH4887317.1 DMT family transporter [Acidaminobacter sp. JC074]
MLSTNKKADILLFITATGWAMSTIIIKVYADSIPIFHIMFGRYILALLMISVFKWSDIKKIKRSDVLPGIVLGFFTFLAFTLAIWSLSHTSASKSGFLVAMSVLFVPIVTTFINKKLPNKWVTFSVFLSIIGLYFISGMNGGSFNFGDLLALLCAASYTAYIMIMDRHAKHINESILVFLQFLLVTILSVIGMLVFEDVQMNLLIDAWAPILVMGIFGTAITNFAQTTAQKTASPESVGLILLGEPLLTLVMAAVFIKEQILLSGLFGAGLLLVALVITVLKDV